MEKLIGYYDASFDLPEEIIMAAGFEPIKILGDVHKSTEPAEQYLFNTFCPIARSALTEALENPGKWAGIVFGHGCDVTNRHYDIWKVHVKIPFIYFVNTPLKLFGDSSRKFFRAELIAFKEALEKQYNVEITAEKLWEAIEKSNKIKRMLGEISELRSIKDIKNSEYYEACESAVVLPKDKAMEKIAKLLEEFKGRAEFPPDKKKVMLTGSDITYTEWMEIMDQAGLRVVRDDLSIGERYFHNLIPEKDNKKNLDPIDALIEYHFNIPMPSTKHPACKRLEYIFECVKESNLSGVLYQNVVFCEVYAYDAVYIRNALHEKGIKVINIERDYTPNIDQQVLNRLEAFREMI